MLEVDFLQALGIALRVESNMGRDNLDGEEAWGAVEVDALYWRQKMTGGLWKAVSAQN